MTSVSFGLSISRRFWYIDAFLSLYSEWGIWLPVLHCLGLVALLWRFGHPTRIRTWSWMILLNGWLLVVGALYRQREIEFALGLAGDLLLRLAMLGLWCFAGLGLPWVVYWVWRHRSSSRPAFGFGRWWFSAVVLLATAEPLMALLDREHVMVAFPERLLDPPAGELRLVSLGESTMVGHPYEPKFGIPQVVAWRLQQMYPQRRVVSENLAVPGINLEQAIAALQRLRYRPHLVLLYSGHNEFMHELEELGGTNESLFGAMDQVLNWSPTFRVVNLRLRQNVVMQSLKSGTTRALVEWPMCSPPMLERRRLRYRRQLEQLAEYGRSQGIAMLWFVPAGSESGYEPNRSIVARATSAAEIAGLNECSQLALERERAADWETAAELYRASLSRHPQFAEFQFRLAECLLELGRTDEARKYFQEALDNDGHPVRTIQPYRLAVAEVAAAFSIPVVFTGDVLRPSTPLGILDRSLFHDNVHPTLRGFFLMGMAGADVLRTSGLLELRFGAPADIRPGQFEDAVTGMEIDRTDVATACRRVANGLRWLARFRFDPSRRKAQADGYLRLAERLEAGEIEPGEAGAEALR